MKKQMTSLIELHDDSYTEFQATVTTRWGSTFLRAFFEKDFITALSAVLPRDSSVLIIANNCSDVKGVVKALRSQYNVFVSNKKIMTN